MNNDYGKWPLVVGSSEFDQEKFDHATVAGISILRSIRSQEFHASIINRTKHGIGKDDVFLSRS